MPRTIRLTKLDEVNPVTAIGVEVDGAEQLGFAIRTRTAGGSETTLEITSVTLGELLAEIAYQGQKTARDYEYELMAMIARGADRARTERPA